MTDKKVVLVSTSTADLSREYFEKNEVVFIPNIAIINDEVVYDDYSADVDKYFNDMKKGALPTSSNNNKETYYEVFKKIAESGNDFVMLDISSGITQSGFNAKLAAEEINNEYKGINGFVIDTLSVSSGQGMILDRAVELRNSGKSAEEIANIIEEEKHKCIGIFTIKSLTHLYRGGRVSRTSMLIGNALNICPIISIDKEGKLTPFKKAHGFKASIKDLISLMEENADGGIEYNKKVFIVHALERDNAEYLRIMIKEKFPKVKDVDIYNVHLNIGAHTGAGVVGIFFWGNERL